MKLSKDSLSKFTRPAVAFFKKDAVPIFFGIIAIVFGFLIWRIGNLSSAEPSQDTLDEQLKTVVRPKIDADSIKRIEELEDQNIDIQSYFTDRSNPFQE